jgi:Putative protein-S-isoprenylcysteine methyltransferase
MGKYFMPINIILLIVLALIWYGAEGLLLARDKNNDKGSTEIDKRTRLYNTVSTILAIMSALFVLLPSTDFSNDNVLSLTVIGAVLAICGLTLRHVSIHILGEYFRTTVEIDRDQQIIQTGPYHFIRHPSYSGIILFFLGYGILSGNYLCLVCCVILPTAALAYRIKIEEKALVAELGKKYEDYRTKTKKLIPFIW